LSVKNAGELILRAEIMDAARAMAAASAIITEVDVDMVALTKIVDLW
jgi:hypothetical protein